MLSSLYLALFSQSSLELLVTCQENCVELACLFQFIFIELSLCHPFHCHSQELILSLRVLSQCLYKKKIRAKRRCCSEGDGRH
jgi:hypothetical protein